MAVPDHGRDLPGQHTADGPYSEHRIDDARESGLAESGDIQTTTWRCHDCPRTSLPLSPTNFCPSYRWSFSAPTSHSNAFDGPDTRSLGSAHLLCRDTRVHLPRRILRHSGAERCRRCHASRESLKRHRREQEAGRGRNGLRRGNRLRCQVSSHPQRVGGGRSQPSSQNPSNRTARFPVDTI